MWLLPADPAAALFEVAVGRERQKINECLVEHKLIKDRGGIMEAVARYCPQPRHFGVPHRSIQIRGDRAAIL